MNRSFLTRYAWLSLAAALATIGLKTGAYLLTGSVGLLSDALESLVNRLGGSGGACDPTADIVNCALAGSPYVVSIKTPSPSCTRTTFA